VTTGDYLNITQADALETLLDWEQATQSDDGGERGRLVARVIEVEQLTRTIFDNAAVSRSRRIPVRSARSSRR
jgi:hypothetical protein